jgi:hypothetical protein
MSTVIGESYAYPLECAHRRRIELEAVVTIGATGAIASSIQDDPGFTIARASTGVYIITYPAGADLLGGSIDFTIVSANAVPTVKSQYVTAFAPNSGTATIRTFLADGATAVDPATGDVIRFQIFLNARRDY